MFFLFLLHKLNISFMTSIWPSWLNTIGCLSYSLVSLISCQWLKLAFFYQKSKTLTFGPVSCIFRESIVRRKFQHSTFPINFALSSKHLCPKHCWIGRPPSTMLANRKVTDIFLIIRYLDSKQTILTWVASLKKKVQKQKLVVLILEDIWKERQIQIH